MLKSVVAAYHQKAPADLTVAGVDMFLVMANNVRKSAELLHSFEYNRITALLDIDGMRGGPLSSAKITTGEANFGVKEIVAVQRMRPDGTYIPLDFARADIPIERDRTELEFSDNLFPYLRYPSDAQIVARGTSSSVIQRGRVVYIYPFYANISPATFQVNIEGYGWMSPYTADQYTYLEDGITPDITVEPEDFLLGEGSEYMQWAIVCALNPIFGTFVVRQEGNVAPPEKQRDVAWETLLLWDSYQIDGNTTRSR